MSALPPVFGLLITKDDSEAFGDWCRDQLRFYEQVVCLDGSEDDATARQAVEFADRLIYRHEREFDVPAKTDHGLRRMVHEELVRLFGPDLWIMCCHTDEFCYHDPRTIAALATRDGYDLVSWYSPHFYPHPSERPDLAERLKRPVQERFQHYHWSHFGNGLPWIEDRLYRAGPGVAWDATTHGSVRPHGLCRPAPFRPIYRHFKVCSVDLAGLELDGHATRYRGHWQDQEHRTGLPFRVERIDDLFVTSIPNYACRSRFDGVFGQPWNMGEEYRPDGDRIIARSPQSISRRENTSRPIVAFGPRLPGFGSWDWVGADIAEALSSEFDVRIFDRDIPACDAVVFVKFRPARKVVVKQPRSPAVIYSPIDVYGGSHEIDADCEFLQACDRVVIHCERLWKYFTAYAPVEYIDHHVKFAAPLRETIQSAGPLLWVGVRTNLPPLVEWVNRRRRPGELWVLTNPADPSREPRPKDVGFRPHNAVRLEWWSGERQTEWTALARAALDIKGDDFRARHKPPSKAMDFLASGVPLALEPSSSAAEHLARLGFEVASVDDWERWLSREYAEATIRCGRVLRDTLSRPRIGERWKLVIEEALASSDK